MTMMEEEWGEKKERWRTLLGRCAYSAYRFPVQFWTAEESNHTSFMGNILTFPHFLNQDKNLFISHTAANMLVNATDFKFPSKSTF
jgi:hypothetical protein